MFYSCRLEIFIYVERLQISVLNGRCTKHVWLYTIYRHKFVLLFVRPLLSSGLTLNCLCLYYAYRLYDRELNVSKKLKAHRSTLSFAELPIMGVAVLKTSINTPLFTWLKIWPRSPRLPAIPKLPAMT